MAAIEEMIRVFESENIETEVIQTVRNLARNMIWMMRSFALARENGIPYPDTETEACTNFIKRNDNQR